MAFSILSIMGSLWNWLAPLSVACRCYLLTVLQLELQRDVAYTYYETASLEQKDADTTKNESGFFEGYKLRTPEE